MARLEERLTKESAGLRDEIKRRFDSPESYTNPRVVGTPGIRWNVGPLQRSKSSALEALPGSARY
jgi:hypothetical protein